ncbi:hypothetical protein D3OALGB2SA_3775 [Olavius algarvensis associated proteobacterium Delta 3]|nr:hypothetical protein D3OALGB2SA_3775 [Olavius algarvensis associated proteobacterium Delta 3]
MKTIIAVIVAVLLFSTPVYANCIYNGGSYPTGTVIGPLVCSPNGTWQPRR